MSNLSLTLTSHNKKVYSADEHNIISEHELKIKSRLEKSSIENNFILKREGKEDVEYRCTYGGSPLVIWAVDTDSEEINSSEPIEPIFIEKSYLASKLRVEKHIRSTNIEKNYLHFNTQNPANGGTVGLLYREDEQDFYVNTASFPPVKCNDSKQTVSNYEIIIEDNDEKEISFHNIIPYQNYSYSALHGVFVFEKAKYLEFVHYAWDQLFKWNDYWFNGTQDLYYDISPSKSDDNTYYGKGFVVCGSDKETIISLKNKKAFSKKRSFIEEAK